MEVSILVENFLQTQEFTSKRDGALMRRYSFIGVTSEQYSRKICFTCLGDDTWNKLGLREGCRYQVSFDVSSREWQGRWYTDVIAWRAIPLDSNQGVGVSGGNNASVAQVVSPKPSVNVEAKVASQGSSDDGLPF